MRIEKINLTKDNLIKIKEIDDLFYTDDHIDLDWYLERYNSKHIGYLLLNDHNVCIGYIVSVPVKKELYDALIKGVLVNDLNINPDMFIDKSKYNYIVSFIILEEYRHQGLGLELIKNIIKTVDKGFYCALTVSQEGAAISKKFMHLKKQINDDIAVFEIKI